MPDVPVLRLNNGVEIPQLGFGVFQVPPPETAEVVKTALRAGYRHIDTAQMYGNEKGVGQAVAESDLDRDDLFITSKLNNDAHGRDNALRAFDGTLAALGLERIDLFLIHWPIPRQGLFVETWQALEEVYRDGRARAIGVSNFTPHHLGRLAAETEITPALDQIELHPYLTQVEARAYNADHEIATEAWSPIGGQGGRLVAYTDTGVLRWTATFDGDAQAVTTLGSTVYVGGHFDKACKTAKTGAQGVCVDGSDDRVKLAALDAIDGHLQDWTANGNGVLGVVTLASSATLGTVAAGGAFTTINGANHKRFAQFR